MPSPEEGELIKRLNHAAAEVWPRFPLSSLAITDAIAALKAYTGKPEPEGIPMQFNCPECGSHFFGTSNCTSPEESWVGNCHGYLKSGQPCRFKWSRNDDDKYFFPCPSLAEEGQEGQSSHVATTLGESTGSSSPVRTPERKE